jgi:hypothetical protein
MLTEKLILLISVLWRFTGQDDLKMKLERLKFKYLILIIAVVISAVTFMLPVHASNLSMQASTNELGIGGEVRVEFTLDTESEQLNALEGKITFPGDLLRLKSIEDGNSIINLWVERPHIANNISDIFPQEIIFSGITPGGFTGSKLPIFSLVFEARKEGAESIKVNEFKALLNDGKGTLSKTNLPLYNFKISKNIPVKKLEENKDVVPPEDFEIFLSRKEDIFNGRYFIVFTAQDKGSGIDYYEMYESKEETIPTNAQWEKGSSPYELKDQNLGSYITVRVFDKAGNKRTQVLKPQQYREWSERNSNRIILASIILGSILLLSGTALLWKRFGKRLVKK